jgi:uncharacterized protein (DUF433 family)
MSLASATEVIPFEAEANGVVRVRGTRITLETVIAAFQEGATPEEIVQQYPTLNLGDVYYLLGYYLRHTSEVDAYLQQRKARAQSLRRENEQRFDPEGVRDRLLARRSGRGS